MTRSSESFRKALTDYVRLYAFLSQIITFTDAEPGEALRLRPAAAAEAPAADPAPTNRHKSAPPLVFALRTPEPDRRPGKSMGIAHPDQAPTGTPTDDPPVPTSPGFRGMHQKSHRAAGGGDRGGGEATGRRGEALIEGCWIRAGAVLGEYGSIRRVLVRRCGPVVGR